MAKVCVYTTVFEGFDDLKPQPLQTVECDYYCFTDEPERVTVAPWRPVRVDGSYLPGAEPRLVARYIKTVSHRALREIAEPYDLSIWIDASIQILRSTFAETVLEAARETGLAFVVHPERDCVYDEVEVSLGRATAHKYDATRMREQVEHYRAQGYPSHNGLFAGGVVARDMRRDTVRRLDEAWWEEVERWTVQDQLSLPYVLWQLGERCGAVDVDLWRNPLFEVMPHLEPQSGGLLRQARAEYSAREYRPAPNGHRPGVYVPERALWRLLSRDGEYRELSFGPAEPRMVPLAGDWDGDGLDSPGIYDPETGTFFLRNSCSDGPADVAFSFGPPGAIPVVGDWSGSGRDSVGIFLPGEGSWALRHRTEAGPADVTFSFGEAGSRMAPIAGDWDGQGRDRVGFYSAATSSWFLAAENEDGARVEQFELGPERGLPVVGDWDGDGADEVGVYVAEQGRAFLADANAAASSGSHVLLDPPGARPVAGRWG